MAKLFDKITVEVEYPSGTWTAIEPLVEDVVLSKKRKDGEYLYRLSLDSEMAFRKAAWDFISDIEVNDHCSELAIRITCQGDTLYEGLISLSDSDFDFSNCICSIKTRPDDVFTCIEDGLKNEINILADGNNETLYTLIGETETLDCPGSGTTSITGLLPVNPPLQDSCLTFPDTWAVLENHFTFITPSGSGAAPPFSAEHRTVWVRQKVTSATAPPGLGWVDIGGGEWARKPVTVYDQDNSTGPPPEESEWHQLYNLSFGDGEPIDNGRTLQQVLEFMLSENDCSLTVVSDFFTINPDFTAPSNDAYTAAQDKLANLLFFQKSDVKRIDVSNNATSGKMTMEELFSWMANRLQVFPSIVGGNLRLEHISYYENKPVSLDLTASIYARWLRRSNRYSYLRASPRFLKFPQYESTNNVSFDGLAIQFGIACSDKDSNEQQFPSGRFVTDLASVINTPDAFTDDGFVVVNAIEFLGDLYADTEIVGGVGGAEFLNGHLSMPNLHDNYWMDYAYQESGLMNNVTTAFNSTRPTKRGTPITIPGMCCDDFIDFDPATKVTTLIGDGEVERVTYSVRNGTMTFELVYANETAS